MTILEEILAYKRQELAQVREEVPFERLERMSQERARPLDFASALAQPGLSLIAEVKRASPSQGPIAPRLEPVHLARLYQENGSRAISVLTEGRYFQGHIQHLSAIRAEVSLPLLRKDFLFEEYQIYEARAYGADAVLLIAAILPDQVLRSLLSLTRELGLEALLEVHNREELERALAVGPRIIGINNRNLIDFSVDLDTTIRLRPHIPGDIIVVSESGIRSRADVERLAEAGVDAILVGEALVTAQDLAAKVRELASLSTGALGRE